MIAETFHTLVLQPTTLCNLDCSYCYLPGRRKQSLMSPMVASSLAVSIALQASAYPVDVVWHGGEPLTTPISHMRDLLSQFEPLRKARRVRHGVQTNATLIDNAWCDLFRAYRFQVGVSIDGPAICNAARVDWAGKETFSRTMRGIGRLREAGISYSAICVITPETVGSADTLMRFFTDLGCSSVGFNLEEHEGLNLHRPAITVADAERFWGDLWELRESGATLPVRDLDRLCDWINARRTGNLAFGTEPVDPIPTVAFNGDVVVLSPELLGISDSRHRNFKVGNVLGDSLPAILRAARHAGYVREFRDGLASCAATCEFFDFCRGAHAGNRYFESGSFAITETAHCRNTRQALIRAAATYLDREEVIA